MSQGTYQETLTVETPGRRAIELTSEVHRVVSKSGLEVGLVNIFVHHTSASLMIQENADPDVLLDTESFFTRLVPDGDRLFVHRAEGPDDMPAHIRTVLTQVSISVPITAGRCQLGPWQGIYLYEHRHRPHRRRVTITVQGLSAV